MSEIRDALETAAGAGDYSISSLACAERGDMRATPTKRRITGAKLVIRMFLEAVPPEMTAVEILCAMDELD